MITFILLNQIVIMFILILIGFSFYRFGLITQEGSKDLAKILLYLVIPCIVIKSFFIPSNQENITIFIQASTIAIIAMLLSIVISYLIYGTRDGIANFASAFSNAGFIGIPLVQATLGSEAVFYILMTSVLVNVLQWTYGSWIITKDKSIMSLKNIIQNPIIISFVLGLIIFFLQIPIPSTVVSVFDTICNINTPLAMIVSGVYLAQSSILKMICKKKNYVVCFIRLIFIPLITLFVLSIIPFGSLDIKLAILITSACPVGSNVAIYAQKHGKDYSSAIELVCISTLLCLITIPLIVSLSTSIL